MKTFDKVEILKNVGSSWFALGVNILVGVSLSPYILHRLGDHAFGLWILVFSITGYYGLFDLGIRSSIIRYVAKYAVLENHNQLNRLINTAMFSYIGIGLVAMLITVIGFFHMSSIFQIPADFATTARLLFLMVGAAVAAGFPLGRFAAFLSVELHQHQFHLVACAAHRPCPSTWPWIVDHRAHYCLLATGRCTGQRDGGTANFTASLRRQIS